MTPLTSQERLNSQAGSLHKATDGIRAAKTVGMRRKHEGKPATQHNKTRKTVPTQGPDARVARRQTWQLKRNTLDLTCSHQGLVSVEMKALARHISICSSVRLECNLTNLPNSTTLSNFAHALVASTAASFSWAKACPRSDLVE